MDIKNPKNSIEESELQICKSTGKSVPKQSYEIEDYVFLVSPTELDEHNFVKRLYQALRGMYG